MMELETLQLLWFIVFGVVIAGYSVLDGFDLGVGMLHLTARSDHERRIYLNSIGPVWDGNEVWLIVAGGALLGGFPNAHAVLFSAFYMPFMLLLFALIFRAVAIEFRSKVEGTFWRSSWDTLFFLGSCSIAFILGMILGHLVKGIPLDSNGFLIKEQFQFFHFYPVMVGVLSISLFLLHGALYLFLKTEGEIQEHVRQKIGPLMINFVIIYAGTTMATLIYYPHMAERMKDHPLFFLLGLGNMLAIANITREVHHKRKGRAFISSSVSICFFIALYALGTFPDIVRSTVDGGVSSLTIYNGSSSATTLRILLTIVAIGIPLVLSYTVIIYRFFSGKVKLDPTSY